MTVRAKFWIKAINNAHVGGDGIFVEVQMAPVYDDANKDWSKYTPQGEIKMSITNPAAVAQFELGKKYYIDFTPAD